MVIVTEPSAGSDRTAGLLQPGQSVGDGRAAGGALLRPTRAVGAECGRRQRDRAGPLAEGRSREGESVDRGQHSCVPRHAVDEHGETHGQHVRSVCTGMCTPKQCTIASY